MQRCNITIQYKRRKTMSGQTDSIVITQNNTIRHIVTLQHKNQGYIIICQYNKTQNNIIT